MSPLGETPDIASAALATLTAALDSSAAQKSKSGSQVLVATQDFIENFDEYMALMTGAGRDESYYEVLAEIDFMEMVEVAQRVYCAKADDLRLATDFITALKLKKLVGVSVDKVLN